MSLFVVSGAGAGSGSSPIVGINTNVTVSGALAVTLTNSSWNTTPEGTHIRMHNPSASAQSMITSYGTSGTVLAKWRTDFDGNISWVAKGRHDFYVGGDYQAGGTTHLTISSAGLSVLTPLACSDSATFNSSSTFNDTADFDSVVNLNGSTNVSGTLSANGLPGLTTGIRVMVSGFVSGRVLNFTKGILTSITA